MTPPPVVATECDAESAEASTSSWGGVTANIRVSQAARTTVELAQRRKPPYSLVRRYFDRTGSWPALHFGRPWFDPPIERYLFATRPFPVQTTFLDSSSCPVVLRVISRHNSLSSIYCLTFSWLITYGKHRLFPIFRDRFSVVSRYQ